MVNKYFKENKMKKVKLRLFPESFAIDSLLAKRQLATSGFHYSELESPILYRGDERGPDVIFKEGFFRKPYENNIPLPNITPEDESKTCIATTKDLVYAVGFADNPSTTLGFFNEPKKEFGWVYILYTDKGIDLTLNKNAFKLAHHVKEVVVTDVPPEHIIAAFQIKTTNNGIYPYIKWYAGRINAGLEHPVYNHNVSWQIQCTKFEKNPNFSKDIDLLPYQKNIDNFLQIAEKGYFRIPWSPYPEKVEATKKVTNFFNSFFKTNKQQLNQDQNITPKPKL